MKKICKKIKGGKPMKKILIILLMMIVTLPTILQNVVLANTSERIYTIRQITNEKEIVSNSSNDYIITYEENGINYALSSTTKENTPLFAMGLDNSEVVKIDNDKLVYSGKENILCNFTKSKDTVAEGKDKPAIESSVSVYNDENQTRKQLKFSVTNTQRNPAGIEYTQNGYSFNFHFDNNGYVKLEQNNGVAKYSYLRFLSSDKRFLSSTPGKAAKLKIYEVIKKYKTMGKYDVSKIESQPQYPNPGSVNLSKTANIDDNYESNGIASIKLEVESQPIKKDTNIVLILDDSNSVYEKIDGNSEIKKVDAIKNTASNFANKILELNQNNKVAVVKFAGEIIDKQETEELGFSNDIEKIKTLINKEKTDFSGGTNYTVAFEEANKLLERVSEENKDSIAIFISDGAPSIYNRLKYTVYKETLDGEIGHHADNWVEYFLNNNLKENELMKEAGTKIYTIGSENSNKAITSTGAFVVNSDDTKKLLKNLSTEKSYYYNWDNMQKELEEIYEEIFRELYIYPKNGKVTDVLSKEVILLNKNINNLKSKIQIKHGEQLIEEITFNEKGTEAYSTLDKNKNILNITEDGNYTINSKTLTYDSNSKIINWNIGNIDNNKYSLEYFVYLTRSSNIFDDGNDRETGKYDTNKEAFLEYTNHIQENIRKEFEKPKINWKLIKEDGEVIKTGDNIIYTIVLLILLVGILIIHKIRKVVVK